MRPRAAAVPSIRFNPQPETLTAFPYLGPRSPSAALRKIVRLRKFLTRGATPMRPGAAAVPSVRFNPSAGNAHRVSLPGTAVALGRSPEDRQAPQSPQSFVPLRMRSGAAAVPSIRFNPSAGNAQLPQIGSSSRVRGGVGQDRGIGLQTVDVTPFLIQRWPPVLVAEPIPGEVSPLEVTTSRLPLSHLALKRSLSYSIEQLTEPLPSGAPLKAGHNDASVLASRI